MSTRDDLAMEKKAHNLHKKRSQQQQTAFYAAHHKTSAEIISDARRAVKSVSTRRPFTPLEARRPVLNERLILSPAKHPLPPSSSAQLNSSGTEPGKGPHVQRFPPRPPKSATSSSASFALRRASLPKIHSRVAGRRVQSGPKERTPALETRIPRSPSLSNLHQWQSGTTANSQSPSTTTSSSTDGLMDRRVQSVLDTIDSHVTAAEVTAVSRDLDVMLTVLDRERSWQRTMSPAKLSEITDYFLSFVQQCWPAVAVKAGKLLLRLDHGPLALLRILDRFLMICQSLDYEMLFLEGDISGDLLSTASSLDVVRNADCLVQWSSLVNLLCNSDSLKQALYEAGCVEVLAHFLSKISPQVSVIVDHPERDRIFMMSRQVTGALRKLADIIVAKRSFISTGVLFSVLRLCHDFLTDATYILNVAGILSKLTQNGDCALALVDSKCDIGVLFSALTNHMECQDIVVRVCFSLGNLAAKVDDSRPLVASSLDGTSLDILAAVATRFLDTALRDNDKPPSAEVEDVIVKVVRVFANVAISQSAALKLANHRPIIDSLLRILSHRHLLSSDELFVNSCVAVNNLSYYADGESFLIRNEVHLTSAVSRLVTDGCTEVSLEAIRVLGNLTLSFEVRQQLKNDKGLEWIVCLLDSSRNDLVYASCGVLVNMMIDKEARTTIMRRDHALVKLIDALADFSPSDWSLAGLMCQILANYSEDMVTPASRFGDALAKRLEDMLCAMLDPSFASEAHAETGQPIDEDMFHDWQEEFVPVARVLLSRLSQSTPSPDA